MDKLGDLLQNLPYFSSSGEPNGREYAGMFKSWENIAGQKLSQYSRIVDIENHSLLIEVDHPAIIQLLQFKYREIISKIRIKYPQLQISDLRMFVKNPDFQLQRSDKRNQSFSGDGVLEKVGKSQSSENFDKIDDKNFRDLLQDMKKRSQL